MRNFKTKAICFISSAVLLCGASGITANAATDYNFSAASSTISSVAQQNNFTLNRGDFTLSYGGTVYIWVNQSSNYTLPTNATVQYQWYKNETAISGATEYKYPVTSGGTYYCKVSVNTPKKVRLASGRPVTTYSTKTYNTGSITVTEQLVITKQPTGGVFDNDKGYFDMFVTVKGGTGSYKYKWYWNGKETSLTGTGMRVYGAGTGYCVITDTNGKKLTTQNVTVSYAPLKIASQPIGGYFNSENGYYDMYVTPTGGRAPYKYKWYWNGKETSLTGNGMRVYNEGTGYCVITDANGNKVTSNTAKVVYAPFNVYYEKYGSFDPGASLQMMDLTVTATGGTGEYTYNWQKKVNGKWEDIGPYSGKEATYTVMSFDVIDNEEYEFMFKRDDMYIYHATFYNSYRCIVGYTDSTGYHTKTLDEIKVYSVGKISRWWPIPNVPM